MTIESDEAFSIEEYGIKLEDDDGNVVLYVTGGTGNPLGTQAPIPTVYVSDTSEVWKKFGPGVNDWMIQGESVGVRTYDYDVKIPTNIVMMFKCPEFDCELYLDGEAYIL